MARREARFTSTPGTGVAEIATAGEGYFWGISIQVEDYTAGLIVSGIDQCRVWQFVLPFRAVVRQITSEVTTGGGGGKKYGVGLFDANGNLLLETGALDANVVAINTTAITAVTLEPGIYWQGQTTDSVTTQLRELSRGTSEVALMNDSGVIITDGTTGNAGVAGILPATMGALATNAVRQPAAVLFLP